MPTFFSYFFGTDFDLIKNTLTFAHSFTKIPKDGTESERKWGCTRVAKWGRL